MKILSLKFFYFKLFLFVYLLSIQLQGYSQYYLTGEDPWFIKWKQINTKNFIIIFPESFTESATFTANYLQITYNNYNVNRDKEYPRIPVIIHNQSVQSNGMVVWAPKRMELFTLPPQTCYAQDWLQQLSLHETRHVTQIQTLNKGFSTILNYAFGQQAIGGISGLVPRWFYEGDAVFAETQHSFAGRGRLPSFNNPIAAINLTGSKRLTYDQAFYGSYKRFVPSYYAFGYNMVKYGYDKYTDSLWNSVLSNTGKKPFLFTPFYFGLKKHTGLSKEEFYNQAFNYTDSIWYETYKSANIKNNSVSLTNTPVYYTNYFSPYFINDSTIIALKEGMDNTLTFVLIGLNGNEKTIFKPGLISNNHFSYSSGKIAWEEELPDFRWQHRSYTKIKLYELRTKKTYSVLKKGRYFSPSLSPDGCKIAAIVANKLNIFSIIIINLKNASIDTVLSTSDIIQTPSWLNQNEIAYIILDKKGKSIEKINLHSKTRKTIYRAGYINISYPKLINKYICFNADYGISPHVLGIDTNTLEIVEICTSKYGSSNPDCNAKGSALIYNDYNSHGHNIPLSEYNENNFRPVPDFELLTNFADTSKIIDFTQSPAPHYEIKPYNKLIHTLNFHSWAPFYFNYDELEYNPFGVKINPGVLLLSQNNLGTAYGTAGYGYTKNGSLIKASFIYKGFFPIIKFDVQNGGEPIIIPENRMPQFPLKSDNINFSIQTYIPLNLSRGQITRLFTPAVKYSFSNAYIYNPIGKSWFSNYSSYLLQANIYLYKNKSYRDLLPPLGLISQTSYLIPLPGEYFSTIFNFSNRFYFPGFFKHHHIVVSANFEKQSNQIYKLNGFLSFPRGFQKETSNRLYTYFFDYRFPILYPDLSFYWLFYLKRINLNLFYDCANSKIYSNNGFKINNYFSYGFEITTDMHILRIIFPFHLGYRLSFSKSFNKPLGEFIFYIDINGY
ncbi:MAG: hypothetical protein JXB17_12890 [Bacteroidales bacterium]|nr:hypothetical protein [Bacteroidales bacterium]